MIEEALQQMTAGNDLNADEARQVIERIMQGSVSESLMARLLTAWADKGESADELTGAARAMRAHALPLVLPEDGFVVDTCGTGGDGADTFNISTLAALTVAAAGVYVPKHGNRSVSSRCGSADLLEALGVNLDLSSEEVQGCLLRTGFAFVFAPLFHPAMKYAMPVRKKLARRTLFNLLGPLTNPAQVPCQVVGVYEEKLMPLYASVLNQLGLQHACVVYGAGGLDELSLAGANHYCEVKEGQVSEGAVLQPQSVGLSLAPLDALKGGDLCSNLKIAREVLSGTPGAPLDCVALNAGMALYVAGKCSAIEEGVGQARSLLLSGEVQKKLDEIVSWTKR